MITPAQWEKLAKSGRLSGSKSCRELARELGCDHVTVAKWRRRFGIPIPDGNAGSKPTKVSPINPFAAWPKGARNEIALCVGNNDNPPPGWKFVPARKMVERLRDRWSVDATEADLDRYCGAVLGRRGWRFR